MAIAGSLADPDDSAAPPSPTDIQQTLGGGIEGTVDGRRIAIGSGDFVRTRCSADRVGFWRRADALAADGLTPIAVACDGVPAAWIGLADTVRPDARAAIDALRARGWELHVLSGDHGKLVQSVAGRVGIPGALIKGDMSPEAKAQFVRNLVARRRAVGVRGPVVMVGDGVNDAAALACADVGVAVHGGAEASLAAADIYLTRPGLASLVDLTDGCASAMRTIRRNLGVSVLYNATAGALAVLGLVGPLVAALVMPVSSLTVVALSLRARSFDRRCDLRAGSSP
jgi:Cu2+-exporting ATPase